MTDETAAQALPKYVQISERLIREIAAGRLADGARLPPERDMAADFGISVGTLRKALKELEDSGLLDRIQGSGNYIRQRGDVRSVYALFRLELLGGGGLPTARVLNVRRKRKPGKAPDFGPHDEAFRIRRLRYLDATPVAMEEIWLDASHATAVTQRDLSESLYRFYADMLGLVIARVEDRIGVADIPKWRPEGFRPKVGSAAGFIERVGWTTEGAPIEYSRTWFDARKARYISRMGEGKKT